MSTETTATTEPYPACAKLAAVADESQTVGEFLDWLNSEGIRLARWQEQTQDVEVDCHRMHWGSTRAVERCSECDNDGMVTVTRHVTGYVEVGEPYEALLARFFGVDLDAVERERRQILAGLG